MGPQRAERRHLPGEVEVFDLRLGAQGFAGFEPVFEVVTVAATVLQPEVVGVFADGGLVRLEGDRTIDQGAG